MDKLSIAQKDSCFLADGFRENANLLSHPFGKQFREKVWVLVEA